MTTRLIPLDGPARVARAEDLLTTVRSLAETTGSVVPTPLARGEAARAAERLWDAVQAASRRRYQPGDVSGPGLAAEPPRFLIVIEAHQDDVDTLLTAVRRCCQALSGGSRRAQNLAALLAEAPRTLDADLWDPCTQTFLAELARAATMLNAGGKDDEVIEPLATALAQPAHIGEDIVLTAEQVRAYHRLGETFRTLHTDPDPLLWFRASTPPPFGRQQLAEPSLADAPSWGLFPPSSPH